MPIFCLSGWHFRPLGPEPPDHHLWQGAEPRQQQEKRKTVRELGKIGSWGWRRNWQKVSCIQCHCQARCRPLTNTAPDWRLDTPGQVVGPGQKDMPAGSHTHTQHSHTHNQRNRHAKIGEKRAEKIKAVQLSVTTAGEVPRMWMWMGMGMGMGTGLRMWMWRGSFGVVICQSRTLKATASQLPPKCLAQLSPNKTDARNLLSLHFHTKLLINVCGEDGSLDPNQGMWE